MTKLGNFLISTLYRVNFFRIHLLLKSRFEFSFSVFSVLYFHANSLSRIYSKQKNATVITQNCISLLQGHHSFLSRLMAFIHSSEWALCTLGLANFYTSFRIIPSDISLIFPTTPFVFFYTVFMTYYYNMPRLAPKLQ